MPRPLVLLHGFTGSPESWRPITALLPDREVFAPAGVGHDGTPGPSDPRGSEGEVAGGSRLEGEVAGGSAFEGEVDRLAGEVAARGVAGAHVAGYSMGGRLALGLLVRHPALFASATLIGASPGLADPGARAERAAADERWARLLETEGLDTFVAAWEALPLFASQADLGNDAVALQRRIRGSHDPRGLARALRVIGLARMPDYRPHLAAIDRPVRLVAGERDERFRRLAEEMTERLPRGTLTIVPGAGHNVLLERPEEIAALLREDTA